MWNLEKWYRWSYLQSRNRGTDEENKCMDAAAAAAAPAESLQSCLTLWPHTRQPTPVPGILQASTLEWVAVSFSNAWKWKMKGKWLSWVRLFTTPWTAAYQAPPSMGFSSKVTGVGCHCLLCDTREAPNWSIDSRNSSGNHSKLLCEHQPTDSKLYMGRQKIQNSQHNIDGEE